MSDDPTIEPAEPDASRTGTGRLEAFSDGVFAIAITLLVLDLRVPEVVEGVTTSAAGLLGQLGRMWPQYIAYAISFSFILIMWTNHHRLFQVVRHANHAFLLANGLLLLFITLVPFPTSLLSTYIRIPGASNVAAAIYAGNYFLIALMFNLLWYTARRYQLLDAERGGSAVIAVSRAYRLGPLSYGVALVLALLWVPASIALNVALAAFYALPQSVHRRPLRSLLPVRRASRIDP